MKLLDFYLQAEYFCPYRQKGKIENYNSLLKFDNKLKVLGVHLRTNSRDTHILHQSS